jgi:serine/threonine protein kinase
MESDSGRRWTLDTLLGEGGYGKVFSTVEKDNGAQCVLKLAHDPNEYGHRFDNLPTTILAWEVGMLRYITHPNVVRLVDVGPNFLVMRDAGRPVSCLKLPGVPIATVVKTVLQQVLDVLAQVHALGIAHCDVSNGNVLCQVVNGRVHVTVCDWGNARFVSDDGFIDKRNPVTRMCCTCTWCASPECANEGLGVRVNSKACDVWAAAVSALTPAGIWKDGVKWWREPTGAVFEELYHDGLMATLDGIVHDQALARLLASLIFQPQEYRASAARALAALLPLLSDDSLEAAADLSHDASA